MRRSRRGRRVAALLPFVAAALLGLFVAQGFAHEQDHAAATTSIPTPDTATLPNPDPAPKPAPARHVQRQAAPPPPPAPPPAPAPSPAPSTPPPPPSAAPSPPAPPTPVVHRQVQRHRHRIAVHPRPARAAEPPAPQFGARSEVADVVQAAAVPMYDSSRSTRSSLIVFALVCAGIGLLIVLAAAAPRALVSARWAPGFEDHRLDIAFVGIAITAGLVIALVVSSSFGA